MGDIEFIKEIVDFLNDFINDGKKQNWCLSFNINDLDHKENIDFSKLIEDFIDKVYKYGLITDNVKEIYAEIGIQDIYDRKPNELEVVSMTEEQIILCISMELMFYNTNKEVLIGKYIAKGILHSYFNALLKKLETKAKSEIKLNDLLGFSKEELDNVKIRFNQSSPDANPMELYLKNPEVVNTQWFLWKKMQGYFKVGQVGICLLKIGPDSWLLTTIKRIVKDLNLEDNINYEAEELPEYRKYYGRVIISFHKNFQSQGIYFERIACELIVNQILPGTFDGYDFPGYDKVRLSYEELSIVIKTYKKDWVAALENQKAVYLITDKNNGKLYVGSATSNKGMLLSRWRSYVENGHGGNVELLNILEKEGFEYIKNNFQYTILENYNAKVDDHIILERESFWKEAFKSRKFGYNSN